jgi:hypothetical protein
VSVPTRAAPFAACFLGRLHSPNRRANPCKSRRIWEADDGSRTRDLRLGKQSVRVEPSRCFPFSCGFFPADVPPLVLKLVPELVPASDVQWRGLTPETTASVCRLHICLPRFAWIRQMLVRSLRLRARGPSITAAGYLCRTVRPILKAKLSVHAARRHRRARCPWACRVGEAQGSLLLDRSASAVGGDGGAGDVARAWGGEECDHLGDLLGL